MRQEAPPLGLRPHPLHGEDKIGLQEGVDGRIKRPWNLCRLENPRIPRTAQISGFKAEQAARDFAKNAAKQFKAEMAAKAQAEQARQQAAEREIARQKQEAEAKRQAELERQQPKRGRDNDDGPGWSR